MERIKFSTAHVLHNDEWLYTSLNKGENLTIQKDMYRLRITVNPGRNPIWFVDIAQKTTNQKHL